MKKLNFIVYFVLFLSLFTQTSFSQANFAVVSNNGQTIITTTLTDAVEQASNGDFIYLPPGNFGIDDLQIAKQVHLIGVGHYPQATSSTGPTVVNGTIRFMQGADGSSVQGIRLNGTIICGTNETNCNISNLVVKRCYFNFMYLSYAWNSTTTGSDFLITENIIHGAIFAGNGANLTLSKNIIFQYDLYSRPITLFNNAIVENNIIIGIDGWNGNDVKGTTFRNNILPVGNLGVVNGRESNIYLNNLHTIEEGLFTAGVVQNEGNVKIARENMFVNQEGGAFSYEHDYNLTQEAINAITGTDGTQVGIYGTNEPYKEYAIPPNPNIEFIKVSPSTQPDGKLRIEATVKAQQK